MSQMSRNKQKCCSQCPEVSVHKQLSQAKETNKILCLKPGKRRNGTTENLVSHVPMSQTKQAVLSRKTDNCKNLASMSQTSKRRKETNKTSCPMSQCPEPSKQYYQEKEQTKHYVPMLQTKTNLAVVSTYTYNIARTNRRDSY